MLYVSKGAAGQGSERGGLWMMIMIMMIAFMQCNNV